MIELKEGTEKRIDNTILASGKDKQDVDDDSMVVREATAKDIALNVIEQISFQKHVGCIGKMLLLSMLFVSLLLATIFCMYANVFGRFDFQRILTTKLSSKLGQTKPKRVLSRLGYELPRTSFMPKTLEATYQIKTIGRIIRFDNSV